MILRKVFGHYTTPVFCFQKIKGGTTYVFHTKNDGITYKRADEKYNKGVIVKSDNVAYKSYPIKYAEIIDVWKI